MRSLVALFAFVLMLVGGAAGAVYLHFVLGGSLVALVGAFLIWAVFVAPVIGITASDD